MNDRRAAQLFRVAKVALDRTAVHADHRHALVIGVALEDGFRDGPHVSLVAVVQGVDDPVWVALDDDDLDRLRTFLDLRDHPDAQDPLQVRIN